MKKTVLTLALMAMLSPAVASASHAGHHIVVGLNGLVCDFCAQSMKKVFGKKAAVSAVDVDLTKKTMKLDNKKGSDLTDDDIGQAVIDAGYSVTGITRD